MLSTMAILQVTIKIIYFSNQIYSKHFYGDAYLLKLATLRVTVGNDFPILKQRQSFCAIISEVSILLLPIRKSTRRWRTPRYVPCILTHFEHYKDIYHNTFTATGIQSAFLSNSYILVRNCLVNFNAINFKTIVSKEIDHSSCCPWKYFVFCTKYVLKSY